MRYEHPADAKGFYRRKSQTHAEQDIEMGKLIADAKLLGSGFLRMGADGTMEHIPARLVQIKDETSKEATVIDILQRHYELMKAINVAHFPQSKVLSDLEDMKIVRSNPDSGASVLTPHGLRVLAGMIENETS